MMKKTVRNILVVAAFGVCLFCGCGGKASSSEAWWLRLSDTVSKENQQDTQTEENLTKLSDEAEEIQPGYWEFHALVGLGKAEVESILGQELTWVEEQLDYDVYTVGDVEYGFLKDVDALCSIEYMNLDAYEAEDLASDCFREMFIRYGDDCTFPTTEPRIRDIVLTMKEDLESGVNDRKRQQYNESWREPYTREMEEKVKDYYATDKVTLYLGLCTPLYREQGFYSVSIGQHSVRLDTIGNNGN